METHLLQERDNLFGAAEELETETSLLEAMKKRGPATQLKLNEKTKELAELDSVFAVTLKQIARGAKEESDLTGIRAKMDGLKVQILNLQDLLDILTRTETESSVKVNKLSQKVQGANHSFWFSVSQSEGEKIKDADAGPILRSYAATLLSGLAPNFGYFLENRFNGLQFDLSKITADLQREYLEVKPKKGEK